MREFSGARVQLREWTRLDRRMSAAWLPAAVPPEWSYSLPALGARRSWSVNVWLPGCSVLVGRVSLRGMLAGEGRLGIYLDAPFVTFGYGSDALALLLSSLPLWSSMKLLRVDVCSTNIRALRFFRRFGFEFVYDSWRVLPDGSRHLYFDFALDVTKYASSNGYNPALYAGYGGSTPPTSPIAPQRAG